MGLIGSVLGSALGGIQTGIFGALLTGGLDYLKQKQDNKHKLQLVHAQKEIIMAQGASEVNLANAKALVSSYASDKATYSDPSSLKGFLGGLAGLFGVITDFVRGMTRPGILWYLIVCLTILSVYSILEVGLDEALMNNIIIGTVSLALELVSMAGAWYYCNRQIQKAEEHRRKK